MTFKFTDEDRIELTLWGSLPIEFSELYTALNNAKEKALKIDSNVDASPLIMSSNIQHPFFKPRYISKANRLIPDWTPKTTSQVSVRDVHPVFKGASALVEIESEGKRLVYFEPNYSERMYSQALKNTDANVRIGAVNVGLGFLVSSQDELISKATNRPSAPRELLVNEEVFQVRGITRKEYLQGHNYQMALAKSVINDGENMQLIFCNNSKQDLARDESIFVKTKYFLLGKLD